MRFAALVLVAAVTSLSGGRAAVATHHIVVIDQMKFGALPAKLHVGDTISWVNRDLFRHSATARDGSFDIDLPAGKSGTITLRKAGAIAFACKYHPGMTGVLQVTK
jgi:plastocyanin